MNKKALIVENLLSVLTTKALDVSDEINSTSLLKSTKSSVVTAHWTICGHHDCQNLTLVVLGKIVLLFMPL